MRILKYTLEVKDRQAILVPKGAQFLTVQMQHSKPQLWALCPEAPAQPRIIAIYGTGNPMPNEPGAYIATFQMADGQLVFHVFEVQKET